VVDCWLCFAGFLFDVRWAWQIVFKCNQNSIPIFLLAKYLKISNFPLERAPGFIKTCLNTTSYDFH
jgi:hypothetical protein